MVVLVWSSKRRAYVYRPVLFIWLKSNLDPAGKADLEFNFKELAFNYRSTRPIVQFCNLIQLLRGRAFGLPRLQPQKTWQLGPAADPAYYDINRPVCRQALQNETALVLIVPCLEGEEDAYVQQDPFLRQIAWDDEEQSVTHDILSPMRAKGLQFKRVVLYKFGEHALRTHQEWLRLLFESKTEQPTKEETLPLEYFVNQLYVAASRPRSQLMIVDTDEAIERFWAFAIDDNQQALVDSYDSQYTWSTNDITRILRGDQQSWQQSRDDARQLGNNFFAQGKAGRDPYLMERARQNFLAVGDEANAAEALALKLTYGGKLVEAGQIYAQLDRVDDALRCFWQARSYKEIVELGNQRAELAHSIQHRAAAYLLHKKDTRRSLKFIEQVYQQLRQDDDVRRQIVTDVIWKEVLQKPIEALGTSADNDANLGDADWKKLWQEITGIMEAGVALPLTKNLARIVYEAGDYEESRVILDHNHVHPDGGSKDWIIEVFGETAVYPVRLRWLKQLGRHAVIIDTYEQHLRQSLAEEEAHWVLDAYMQKRDYEGAYRFITKNPSEEDYVQLLRELVAKERYQLAQQVAKGLLRLYVDKASWEMAIQFAEKLTIRAEKGKGRSQSLQIRLDPADRHAHLIRKLARSKALRQDSVRGRLDILSDYLKKHLLPASEKLRTQVTPQEAGAVFEGAGKHIDTLAFYESILEGAWGSDEGLKKWARLRWIKNKYRQADLYENVRRRERIRQEAKSKQQIWNITKAKVDDAPEYPKLGTLIVETVSETRASEIIPSEVSREDEPGELVHVESEEPEVGEANLTSTPKGDGATATEKEAPWIELELPYDPRPAEEGHASQPDESLVSTSAPPVGNDTTEAVSSMPESAAQVTETEDATASAEDVPVQVFIDLEVGERAYRCTLLHKLHILEVRDTETEKMVAVLAGKAEVQDSYGMLTVEKTSLEDTGEMAWVIEEWSLIVIFEDIGKESYVCLKRHPSGQMLLKVQV